MKRPELESETSVKATNDELKVIYRLLKINAIPAQHLDLEGVHVANRFDTLTTVVFGKRMIQTGANIGNEGATMISEALLTNTTLTSLNLASL